jgi:mRNA interferase HigB
MRVHLIKRQTVERFCDAHPGATAAVRAWLTKIRYAGWKIPADIDGTFPTADLLGRGSNRFVFDLAGNRFRLIARYAFGDRQVHLFVCWIGTHAAYDRVCRDGRQFTVNEY